MKSAFGPGRADMALTSVRPKHGLGMTTGHVLVMNAGSSSIKSALFEPGNPVRVSLRLAVHGVGTTAPTMRWHGVSAAAGEESVAPDAARNHVTAFAYLLSRLRTWPGVAPPRAAAHRIVHGGQTFSRPLVLDEQVLRALAGLSHLAPLHQDAGLAGVHAVNQTWPGLPQVGCFDTAFHLDQPAVAHTYALPATLRQRGLRRFGFHGLSCEHSVRYLKAHRPDLSSARLIVAHLGSGTSLTAIRDLRSVATTMGFSTLEGPPMSTRCGSLDPGILLHLLRDGMPLATLEDILYHESGLRGLSGSTGDMAALLDREAVDPDAAFAVACYVYRVQREIGSLVAALDGLDALVFTGGIGEHSAVIRERITSGLRWLGVVLDERANWDNAAIITSAESAVNGMVVAADEEAVIAQATCGLLWPAR